MQSLQVAYGTVSQSVLSFKPPSTGGITTYVITAAASDGCSTSPAGSITLTLQCLPGLQASPGRAAESRFDYAAQKFADGVFSAADSVWPYKTVPRNTQSYLWSVAYIAPGQSSGVLVTSGFQGESTETLKITPFNVGTYMATLTIADGCAQSTSMTTLSVSCDGVAIASVKETAVQVSFNSFMGSSGGFPDVTFDASSSTSSSLATLTYSWFPTAGLRPFGSVTTPLTKSNTVVLTPVRGTTTYTLSVRNGPCPDSAAVTIQVTATCGTLSALLQHPGSSGFAAATYSRTVTWDGLLFPTVCLDGTSSSYIDSNGTVAKWDIVSKRWIMTSAPDGSKWAASANPVVSTTPPTDSAFRDNTTTSAAGTVTVRQFDRTTTTKTVTVQTELTNHHYNRPYTCFKPDVAGQYAVDLLLNDGCTLSRASATISAQVPCLPTPHCPRDLPTSAPGLCGTLWRQATGHVTLSRRLQRITGTVCVHAPASLGRVGAGVVGMFAVEHEHTRKHVHVHSVCVLLCSGSATRRRPSLSARTTRRCPGRSSPARPRRPSSHRLSSARISSSFGG